MLWVCALFPRLALDAAERHLPQPVPPLALLQGPPARRRVLAANAAARAAGLYQGQALEAALVCCPALALVGHRPGAAAALLEHLAAWAWRYSSLVSIEAGGAVLFEIGASLAMFGAWPALQRRLRRELRAARVTHRIALAPTPLAARVFAACSDGAAFVEPGALRAALARVPVTAAGLPEPAASALPGVGLRYLGQVLEVPRAALVLRYGEVLGEYLDRLLGARPDPRPSYRPREVFRAEVEFEVEVHVVAGMVFALRRLLADLAMCLRARGGAVRGFTLRLGHGAGPATRLEVRLLAAEHRVSRLLEFAQRRLERLALPAPVRSLAVEAGGITPLVPVAADLFDPRPADAERWEVLRERLRARLGDAALYQYEVLADPRPERAQQRVAEGAARAAAGGSRARPLWLLPRARDLDEAPARVLAGPERIESGWWDGGDVRRDYYVVELAGGRRAWVYCPAGCRGPWRLHGWFG